MSARPPTIPHRARDIAGAVPQTTSPHARLTLPSGRSVAAGRSPQGADLLTVSAPGGVELAIEFTERGPVLRFAAADIALESPGRIRIACEELDIDARSSVSTRSGGDVRTQAAGDIVISADGDADLAARAASIRSRRGDIYLAANDDVRLKGERIRLNC